jgi:AhpD family alkylhydroperoxidase
MNGISAILLADSQSSYSLGVAAIAEIIDCLIGENMSDHYHDAADLRLLKDMGQLAPKDFEAWLNLDKIVGREDGAIPRKYRELIAIAVACTTQCPYCIEVHTKAAKRAGASREEITETSLLAAALRAGGAATHGAMALKFFDKA